MSYYGAQSPRGFANEWRVWRFRSRAARDQWVENDPSVMADTRRRAVTRREADRLSRHTYSTEIADWVEAE